MNVAKEEGGRIVVLAFGTRGDVQPVAVVAFELAKTKRNHTITFITHSAHEFLKKPLALSGVRFHSISTAPVALPPAVVEDSLPSQSSESGTPRYNKQCSPKGNWKTCLEQQHREECLLAVEHVFGSQLDEGQNLIIFNFFALEGWHLAELYRVPCAVAAPYVVPYSAPASFEREFHANHPLLYKRLQYAQLGEVGWGEVMHWMWPLFTDRWTNWRSHSLHLSSCPLTDPVTDLPLLQDWPQAPPLLYGFSMEVVECPAYWPRSVHVCGFWYAPAEWEVVHESPGSAGAVLLVEDQNSNFVSESPSFALPRRLSDFLSQNTNADCLPIFIGFSSIGSMGYFKNPHVFLKVMLEVLEVADRHALLFTSSYLPLDTVIMTAANDAENMRRHKGGQSDEYKPCNVSALFTDGITLGNNRLFCFSGSVPYNTLFPKCSMVIHHGGSGTTAAALWSGVPQVICPFVLDQLYWAERMAWIGVAPDPLKPSHLFPSDDSNKFLEAVNTVVKAINVASNTAMQRSAAALSEKICKEDGAGKFVEKVTDHMARSRGFSAV